MVGIKTLLGSIGILFLFTVCVNGQPKYTRLYENFSFDRPTDFEWVPDGSDRVAIVTQPGVVYAIQNGAVPTRTVLLDLTATVTKATSELGLLGLAFHPQFKQNGYFFVDYTADNPLRTVIARYTIDPPNSNNVILASRLVILEIAQPPYDNHKGGRLVFGPNGYLYIAMGDGGSAGDPRNNAQNKHSLLGKILRIDVNSQSSGKSYAIPRDNPFRGDTTAGAEEIYAYGLRNPWRFSIDSVTKKLWAGDVGQDKYEEVDTIRLGKNYGWRIMEGKHCYNPSSNCDQSGLELPIWEYGRDSTHGGYCIIGGYVYRGKNIPALVGKYVYGDWGSQNLWALSVDGQGNVHNDLLAENVGAVTTFGTDPANELYFCTYDGKIYRIEKGITPVEQAGMPVFDFQLDQNYPNPFNGETVIPFRIRAASRAVIAIYDMLGRKVATLTDKFFAPGSYTVRWNAGQLASGVYSCRLTAGNETASRLLILEK